MKIYQESLDKIARVIAQRVYGQEEPDDQDRAMAARLVLAVTPVVQESERERIRTLIDPRRLELIAAFLDQIDEERGSTGDREVQRDLRLWAMILRDGLPGPQSVTEVLIEGAVAIGLEPAL